MSQKARVLAALRTRGARGITRVDFHPPTIDGGNPILEVPQRIFDLKKDGHRIIVEGERDGGCAVYRLLHDVQDGPEPSRAPAREPEPTPGLFTPAPRLAIFDEDIEAA